MSWWSTFCDLKLRLSLLCLPLCQSILPCGKRVKHKILHLCACATSIQRTRRLDYIGNNAVQVRLSWPQATAVFGHHSSEQRAVCMVNSSQTIPKCRRVTQFPLRLVMLGVTKLQDSYSSSLCLYQAFATYLLSSSQLSRLTFGVQTCLPAMTQRMNASMVALLILLTLASGEGL